MKGFLNFVALWSIVVFADVGASQSLLEVPSCTLGNVYKVSVPIDTKRPQLGSFDYKYQFIARGDAQSVTVVFIPGGPGEGSIVDYSAETQLATLRENGFPQNFNMLFTDPRGVGCNEGSETSFPWSTFTSEQIADDIVAMIKKLSLKNYVLYGHSYGSVVATMVSAKIAVDDEVTLPRALVISGVVGSGRSHGLVSYHKGIVREWARVRREWPVDILAKIGPQPMTVPFDNTWGNFFNLSLSRGRSLIGGENHYLLGEVMALLSKNKVDEAKKIATWGLEQLSARSPSTFSESLFRQINCHELSDVEPDTVVDYTNRPEIMTGVDRCEGVKRVLDRPYDSAKWQSRAPIFYFAGDRDPNTPYFDARYHYENQKRAPRFFVTVKDGGHNSLAHLIEDCRSAVWDSILHSGDKLSEALKTCKLPLVL